MRSMIIRQLKLFAFILAGYLVQVCVMPYFKVGDITPSMLVASIAVVTVGYGKLRALWIGLIYGILMEIFLVSVPMLNLLLYPICALVCSLFCSDKSASRRQYERSIGKSGRNINPLVRTVFCAFINALIIEVINLTYAYLDGAVLTGRAVGRAATCIFATAALTALIMVPARRLLGFRKPTPESPAVLRYGKPLQLDD